MTGSAETFVKTNAHAHPDFFAAEAAGLRWLAAGGATVVTVLEHGPTFIELERLVPSRPSTGAARRFGRSLATVHDSGARDFGCPPEDAQEHSFTGQLFIGARPMSSTTHRSWGEFYVAERVLPFLRIAVDAGNVTGAEASDIERACARVSNGEFDDGDPPSRIHGDLWSGNVFWTEDGVVLIDPAAHGGHRETDLAMLELFGCPALDEVIAGYEEIHPLRENRLARIPLHQLHPLAVHAAGHGRSYGVALHSAAASVSSL